MLCIKEIFFCAFWCDPTWIAKFCLIQAMVFMLWLCQILEVIKIWKDFASKPLWNINCPCTPCTSTVFTWGSADGRATLPMPVFPPDFSWALAFSRLLRFRTWGFFLPCGLSLQSRAGETPQGNSRARHISKLSSWGQQPLYLLQNRNMVLVTSKSCFLHPYGKQHEQSRAFPKASHPVVCMEELNSSPDCIALWQPVLAPAPWLLSLAREWGHYGGTREERSHHSGKAYV